MQSLTMGLRIEMRVRVQHLEIWHQLQWHQQLQLFQVIRANSAWDFVWICYTLVEWILNIHFPFLFHNQFSWKWFSDDWPWETVTTRIAARIINPARIFNTGSTVRGYATETTKPWPRYNPITAWTKANRESLHTTKTITSWCSRWRWWILR